MEDTLGENVKREQRRAEELAYLYQLALDLIARSNSPPIVTCEIAIDSLLALLDCQRAAILLRDEHTGDLEIVSERGGTDWISPSLYDPFISNRRALVLKGRDRASYLGVLLSNDAEWLGIMIARREPDLPRFGDDEIQLITLLAGVTTSTLLNSRLSRSLAERLELLQTVMDSSPGGLAVIEISSRRLLMANPSALLLLGLTEEALGQNLHIESQDGPLVEWLIESVPPSSLTTFDYRLARGPYTRYLQFQVVPVSADKLLAQVSDVTLLREVEARREADVASVSHDLKTPLAVMNLGLSNLLTYYEQTPDTERRALIEDVLTQIEDMKGAISSLITRPHLAKHETGEVRPTINDPAFYVAQVVHELAAYARARGVQVSWLPSGELGIRLRGNVADLKTVVRNLLSNAIKYTPAGGSVVVETAVSEGTLFGLIVRDTGVGIPPDELDAVFEPGYRARTHGEVEGSGLGLSFVREIVTRLDGTIEVESTVNVGSAFTVILPIPSAAN